MSLPTFLLGPHSREALLHGPSAGALVETAVASEWVKSCRNRGEEPALYYWRSSAVHEIDLIIEHDGRLHGLEVKATAMPILLDTRRTRRPCADLEDRQGTIPESRCVA